MSQPPYGQPNQFGMGNQPNPGPQKSKAGLIAAIVALVVVVVAVAVALVVTFTGDDGDTRAGDTASSQPTGSTTSISEPESSDPAPEPSNTGDGSSVQGEGYTYPLPDDWTDQAEALTEEGVPETIDTVTAWGEKLDGGRANVIVEVGPANGQTNLASLKPSWEQNIASGKRKPTDIDPITIDGYDAIGVRLGGTNSSGSEIVQVVYLTVVDDTIYSLGLSTTPADETTALTMFQQILDGWTWD